MSWKAVGEVRRGKKEDRQLATITQSGSIMVDKVFSVVENVFKARG